MAASDGPSHQSRSHVRNTQSASLPLLAEYNQTTSIEAAEPLRRDQSLHVPLQRLNVIRSHSYLQTEGTTDLDDSGSVEPVQVETSQSNIWTRSPSLTLRNPSISPRPSAHTPVSGASHQRSASKASDAPNLQDVRYGRIALLSPWFPKVDPKNDKAQTWRTWHSRQDVLLMTATFVSLLVLFTNLIATIYTRSKYTASRGVVSMYEGSCPWVKNVDTTIHVFINALSTLLLGASNLCMQVLAAPTRKEVDKAHSNHRWLDIGVPSWRNLRNVSRVRQGMWWCLGLSSIPLHFIYNSAFSSSLSCYGYGAAAVTEAFVYGASWGNVVNETWSEDWHDIPSYYLDWPPQDVWNQTAALIKMQNTALDRDIMNNLTKIECLEIYTNMYADRTNLLMVVQDDPELGNQSLLQYVYQPASWEHDDEYWPCGDENPDGPNCLHLATATQNVLNSWTKYDHPVLYCLNQKTTTQHCRLNYSPVIMIAICCFSTLKCLCIVATMYHFTWLQETPLCTLGDAISSFLERPDPHTSKMGLAARASIDHEEMWLADAARPIIWKAERRSWYTSASKRRWMFTMSITALAIVVATASMASGAHGTMYRYTTNSFLTILQLGFGTANPNAFTAYFLPRYGTRGFIANVIWVNYWQMIISMLYLANNSLLTCQLVSDEWAGYSKDRKTLRVSHPVGIQRSSYFISMPMKYGIPLLAANATLHWLVSQSMFLVSTTTFFPNDIEDASNSFTTTGYSTSAALASICFGILMLTIIILNSFRTLPEGMPLASTCSAAISAACHRPEEDREAHLLPVQWGAIPGDIEHDELEGGLAFTTHRDVKPPVEGEYYLGLPPPRGKGLRPPRSRRWWRRIAPQLKRKGYTRTAGKEGVAQ